MRLIIAMTVIGLRVFVIAFVLILVSTMCFADEPERTASKIIDVIDGAGLQRALDEHAKTPGTVRVRKAAELTCLVQESKVGDEISRHALLIPENIVLDLNGCTLLLDLRSNSHGVRLSNHSGIRNGTIRVVRSENKGSQGIWPFCNQHWRSVR